MKPVPRRFTAVLTLVFLLGAAPAGAVPEHDSVVTTERLTDFETEVETLRSVLQIPGLAVGIVEGGELVWARGFGHANVEQEIPATPATPFRIASVTKTFTATLVMQLVEEGSLDLDEPISQFGVSVGDAGVTVRHLLSHTSQGTPGSDFRYDGDIYANLTTVVEQAGGGRFADLLQERIFSPAGMTSTGPSRPGQASPAEGTLWADLAAPYRWDVADGIVPGTYPTYFSAAAGLISTIEDLARYDYALDEGRLVTPASRTAMFTPYVTPGGEVLPYGLGWFTEEFQGNRLVWHFGGTDIRNPAGRHGWESTSALLLKVPDRGLTLIALANVDTLNRMYRLVEGDVLRQALAVEFYGRFVAEGVPVIDWTAGQEAVASGLEGASDPAVLEVLERELAAYQLTFLGLDDDDGVHRLSSVLREEFDWPPLIRMAPQASPGGRTAAWVVFWVLAGWVLLVAGSVWAVGRRLRHDRSAWPGWVLWQGAALLLGPVAVWAQRLESHPVDSKRAVPASAVAVLAPAAATALAMAWIGEFDLRAVVLGLALGLILVRAPLRVRSGLHFGSALWRSIPWELMSTLSVFAGFLVVVPLLDAWASSFGLFPGPGSLEFWGISSAAALAGMFTTFPVQYWMAARGRVALPGFRIVEAKTVRRTEIAAMAAGSLGLLAAGLLVVGAF